MNLFSEQLSTYIFSPKKVYQENVFNLNKTSFPEILISGWLCFSFYGFINLSLISFLGSGILNTVFGGDFLVNLSLDFVVRYNVIVYLISILFFPLSRALLYFYLSFSLNVLGVSNKKLSIYPNPVLHVFYADFFYLVPIIGGTCRFFAALIYLFQSLRYGSRLKTREIAFILFLPFILVFCMGLSFFMMIVFLVNSLGS
jgi:hypothetical protein